MIRKAVPCLMQDKCIDGFHEMRFLIYRSCKGYGLMGARILVEKGSGGRGAVFSPLLLFLSVGPHLFK